MLGPILESTIRDRLGKLPIRLKDYYDEMYSEIQSRNKYDKILADRAFMWVMSACKPLTSEELLPAISLNSEGAIDRGIEINESQLISLCNNLLVVDRQQKVWRFCHPSVAKYFENNHLGLRQAHCHIAKACLGLLMKTFKEPRITFAFGSSGYRKIPGNRNGLEDRSLQGNWNRPGENKNQDIDIFHPNHPLQVYSRHHWINHVQQAQNAPTEDSMLADLLKAFLGSPDESSVQYQRWYHCIVLDDLDLPPTSCFKDIDPDDISPETCSVFAMCRFSFYKILLDWWHKTPISVSRVNCNDESLLSLAAIAGCRRTCKNLIRRSIRVNLQVGKYGSALAAAACQGNAGIVRLLINKGANVNLLLQNGKYGSALAAAAHQGNAEIVRMLTDRGANENQTLRTGKYGSALAAAAAARHDNLDIVTFLTNQGADEHMLLHSGEYGSALAAAASHGNTRIATYLIRKSTDVNLLLQTGDYGSALAAAAYWGHKECVKLLLKSGAKVNLKLKTGLYTSALHASKASVTPQAWVRFSLGDGRNLVELKEDKLEVEELLRRAGAVENEDMLEG
jgi:ankyrin repeat domain-containing protein 50